MLRRGAELPDIRHAGPVPQVMYISLQTWFVITFNCLPVQVCLACLVLLLSSLSPVCLVVGVWHRATGVCFAVLTLGIAGGTFLFLFEPIRSFLFSKAGWFRSWILIPLLCVRKDMVSDMTCPLPTQRSFSASCCLWRLACEWDTTCLSLSDI